MRYQICASCAKQENNINNYMNNNMENWTACAMCQKTMSPISYQFNITWLNIESISACLYMLISFMSAFQNAPSNLHSIRGFS